MSNYFGSAVPYLLIGVIVYLIFRALIWIMYYRGQMRVPILHEAGFLLLAFWLLTLFSSSVTPTLEFSIKPTFPGTDLIPVKGMIDLASAQGFGAVLGAVFKFVPLGFLIPFLFRRYRHFTKVLALCGGIALFIEIFQLFLQTVDCRLDDVILALLGTFIGYFLFCLLCRYFREAERMGTVKRSRRHSVPFPVRMELEFLVLLMLLCVIGRGTQLEAARVREVKAAQEKQAAEEAAAAQAAAEAEAQRLAEEEAKKLKTSESMPELSIEAGAACLFSIDDDLILYEKNGTEQVTPASTTKLMTALTVLRYCSLDETMTAGEEINLISEGASTASLKVGTSGKVETFLGAMLVPSGNDAAYALANYTGHKILGNDEASVADAIEAFMGAVGDMAAELNLENSNFETPDGDQSDGQYTTARDMVRIARACMENEAIMRLCGASTYRALFDNMDVTYRNTNLLIQPSDDNYYEGATGMKTGSYNDVKCLVASAEIGGKRYVAAVMEDSDAGRYTDAKTLFDYVAGEAGADTASVDTSGETSGEGESAEE
ncbi:VanZ family protein [Lachnoclostridium sp. An131]|uniref:VanZ family protein n=1 Tax=Lachnoclostridium sp. An131 TaxID=1965555 RepID=UPI0013A64C49|nr:VanZ family protein [Lachnoclostridium sp. An131]